MPYSFDDANAPSENVDLIETELASRGAVSQPGTNQFVRLVQEGYDQIATRYLEWSIPSPARMAYLNKLIARLQKPADILELGCGSGKPCTQLLVEHATVTGVDISAAQIALARKFVPQARLIQADMMSLDFPDGSFDAVTAFYSIIHLPRSDQDILIARIAKWIRPGGHFVANFGASDNPGGVNANWLGSKMYWSSYDVNTSREVVLKAGLNIVEAEVMEDNEDGKAVPFLWIFATKEA